MARIVALGASNLTRGFRTIVSSARSVWGPEVEILAALGHGRSYGAPSQFLFRTLPGILKSGLWAELARRPSMTTRALVTDVGNDILYGFSVERTLSWVEEVLRRLARVTQDIVLTGLPLASVSRLSQIKFLACRSMLAPSCRLALSQVIDQAEGVHEGVVTFSSVYGAKFFQLDPVWYGFDPIHPSGLTPFQLVTAALDEFVASGIMAASRRPNAEFLAWSSVHGLAMLLIDGPLRALPRGAAEAIAQQVIDMAEAGFTAP